MELPDDVEEEELAFGARREDEKGRGRGARAATGLNGKGMGVARRGRARGVLAKARETVRSAVGCIVRLDLLDGRL